MPWVLLLEAAVERELDPTALQVRQTLSAA